MSLVIPDEILQTANVSEEELLREIALLLFKQNRLTLAQASRMIGVDRLTFQELLASRNIPVHYSVDDFEADMATLRAMGEL
jgi:predicted HTH domain antitoxin